MDCSTFAFDLHVLGTPPALILSQDQTLKLNWLASALARFSKLVQPNRLLMWLSDSIPPSLSLALELRWAVQVCGVHDSALILDGLSASAPCGA
jgi:hypothetical protein